MIEWSFENARREARTKSKDVVLDVEDLRQCIRYAMYMRLARLERQIADVEDGPVQPFDGSFELTKEGVE
jgi:hypothetical protein